MSNDDTNDMAQGRSLQGMMLVPYIGPLYRLQILIRSRSNLYCSVASCYIVKKIKTKYILVSNENLIQ